MWELIAVGLEALAEVWESVKGFLRLRRIAGALRRVSDLFKNFDIAVCAIKWYFWIKQMEYMINWAEKMFGGQFSKTTLWRSVTTALNLSSDSDLTKVRWALAHNREQLQEQLGFAEEIERRRNMPESELNGDHFPKNGSTVISKISYHYDKMMANGTLVIWFNPLGFRGHFKSPQMVQFVGEDEVNAWLEADSWGTFWVENYINKKGTVGKKAAQGRYFNDKFKVNDYGQLGNYRTVDMINTYGDNRREASLMRKAYTDYKNDTSKFAREQKAKYGDSWREYKSSGLYKEDRGRLRVEHDVNKLAANVINERNKERKAEERSRQTWKEHGRRRDEEMRNLMFPGEIDDNFYPSDANQAKQEAVQIGKFGHSNVDITELENYIVMPRFAPDNRLKQEHWEDFSSEIISQERGDFISDVIDEHLENVGNFYQAAKEEESRRKDYSDSILDNMKDLFDESAELGLPIESGVSNVVSRIPKNLNRIMSGNPIFRDITKHTSAYKKLVGRWRYLRDYWQAVKITKNLSADALALAGAMGTASQVAMQLGSAGIAVESILRDELTALANEATATGKSLNELANEKVKLGETLGRKSDTLKALEGLETKATEGLETITATGKLLDSPYITNPEARETLEDIIKTNKAIYDGTINAIERTNEELAALGISVNEIAAARVALLADTPKTLVKALFKTPGNCFT